MEVESANAGDASTVESKIPTAVVQSAPTSTPSNAINYNQLTDKVGLVLKDVNI